MDLDRLHVICYSLVLTATTVLMYQVVFVLGGAVERDIAEQSQCHHMRGATAARSGL